MVRDVFRLARENSPCIIFIDEVDAIATKRFDAQTGSDREVQRILLELLNQMDGFDQQTTVKVCLFAYDGSQALISRSSWLLTEYVPSVSAFIRSRADRVIGSGTHSSWTDRSKDWCEQRDRFFIALRLINRIPPAGHEN